MKYLTLRNKIIAGVAIAIAVLVFGWCQRREGVKQGQLDQKITASAEKVEDLKLEAALVDADAKVEVKKAIAKRPEYRAARAKIEVKGDTVIADGQSVVLPSLADFVKVADSGHAQDSTAIDKQARSDTLQKVLVGALDDHVDLLQEAKRPRFGTKTGIAIGVVGTAAVVYVAVKIIRVLGHR